MKAYFTCITLLFCIYSATSQVPITSVDTSVSIAGSSFSYTNAAEDTTYNWGVSPNNAIISLKGFNAGGVNYTYSTNLVGHVNLRRVNNPKVAGNFTLEWVQASTNGTTFNLFSDYQNSMDTFLNNHIYNRGTDNLFDNTAANSNDIERLDWILPASYASSTPANVGVAVFDKGAPGTHDPFCIAAITSIDALGNPQTYGNIVRVVSSKYGDPGPSVNYRIVKGPYPSLLFDAGTNIQNIGGVFISLETLGVAANSAIYGYSLFASDLPDTATPANLIDYTNSTYFPLNTPGASGGLDLVAVTGLSTATIVLPVNFTSFNAIENNNQVDLKWGVENDASVLRYDVERSEDGFHFSQINEVQKTGSSPVNNGYSIIDDVSAVSSNVFYYRIKQYEADGSYQYSKTVLVRLNNKNSSALIFPNPVHENLYLNIASTTIDKAVISVYNSAGARVLSQSESLANGNNAITLDGISRLSKDIYQLSIKWVSSGKIINKQFSKQ